MTRKRSSTALPFHPGALYRAPSGRLCVFVPAPPTKDSREPRDDHASFAYVRTGDAARRALADGFSLTRHNFDILREVAS